MPRVLANGVRLHYIRAGQGPDVVMVHGLAANLAFWYLARALTRDFCVTLYDLRGHGRSDAPASGYTAADMAADLGGLLDELGVASAHVVGHSFGGVVALHYALSHPRRVASLVLADVRVRALQPAQRLRDGSAWRAEGTRLAELGVTVPEGEQDVGHYLLEELARARPARAERARAPRGAPALPFDGWFGRGAGERWLGLLERTTVRDDVKAVAGLTRARLRTVTQPVLLMYGSTSRCIPSLRRLMRVLPHGVPVVVPGVGHFHPVLRPRLFIRCLRAFLAAPERFAAPAAAAERRALRVRRLPALEPAEPDWDVEEAL